MRAVSRGDIRLIEKSDLFDKSWYLARYPDVADTGLGAAEHYLLVGARLGRNPSPDFDTCAYLDENKDVAASGINPLLHYEWLGRAEMRAIHVPQAEIGRHLSTSTPLPPMRRVMDGRHLLTQARNREHCWHDRDLPEVSDGLPAELTRILVIAHDFRLRTGVTTSISEYLAAMSARGGTEFTSIEPAPAADHRSVARYVATHDFTIINSLSLLLRHEGLIELLLQTGKRGALYLQETPQDLEELKRDWPRQFKTFIEAAPSLNVLCASNAQQSWLHETCGKLNSYLVDGAFLPPDNAPTFISRMNIAISCIAGASAVSEYEKNERIGVVVKIESGASWPLVRSGLAALGNYHHTISLIDPGGDEGAALLVAVARDTPHTHLHPSGRTLEEVIERVARDHDLIVVLRGGAEDDPCCGLISSTVEVERIVSIFRDHPDVDIVAPRANGRVWRSSGSFWVRADRAQAILTGASPSKTIFHEEQLPRPVSLLRGKHEGEDIYVIGAGASGNFLAPSFFDGKTTIGLNRVFRRFPCTYTLIKEYNGAAAHRALQESGSIPVASRGECGNLTTGSLQANVLFLREPQTYFFDHSENEHATVDLSPIRSPKSDRLVVSWSSITSAMHLAALMGARNIILVGHDCGLLDGKSTIDGYYENLDNAPWTSRKQYQGWLDEIEAQTILVKNALHAAYGCNVVSLNPFVNFGLEGHSYVRTGD